MAKSKKFLIPVIVISLVIMLFLCSIGAGVKANITKVINDTPLFTEAKICETDDLETANTIVKIPKNSKIELVGDKFIVDGIEFQEVKYSSYQGFITYSSIYFTSDMETSEVVILKATSKKMGEDIIVYSVPTDNASFVIGSIPDGTKINVVKNGESGDFSQVIYNDSYGYIYTSFLTEGLTFNQKLALIISCSAFGVLVFIGLITVIVIKKKKKKTFTENTENQ